MPPPSVVQPQRGRPAIAPPPTQFGPASRAQPKPAPLASRPGPALPGQPPPITRFAPPVQGGARTLPHARPEAIQRWALVAGAAGAVVGAATGLVTVAATPLLVLGAATALAGEAVAYGLGSDYSLVNMAARRCRRSGGQGAGDDDPEGVPLRVTIDEKAAEPDLSSLTRAGEGAKKEFYDDGRGGRWCVAKNAGCNADVRNEVAALREIAAVARAESAAFQVTPVLADAVIGGRYAYHRPYLRGTPSKGEEKANFPHALFELGGSAKTTARAELTSLRDFLTRHSIGDLQVIVAPDGHICVYDPNGFHRGVPSSSAAIIGQWLRALDERSAVPRGKVNRD